MANLHVAERRYMRLRDFTLEYSGEMEIERKTFRSLGCLGEELANYGNGRRLDGESPEEFQRFPSWRQVALH